MSRSFVAPQAGRQGKSGALPDEDNPWATSASVMRSYEPAEMRSCRSGPASAGRAPSEVSKTIKVGLPRSTASHAESSVASGSTCSASQASRSMVRSQTSEALVAPKHGYFPHRDEFHPRSKRLLYETALRKVCGNSEASGSVVSRSTNARADDDMSCFTIADSKVSKASKSSSTSSLARLPTADSQRVDMIGGVAKRRAEFNRRSPMLSKEDEKWYIETYEKQGPAGMIGGNFPSNSCGQDLKSYGNRILQASAMFSGQAETFSRRPKPDHPTDRFKPFLVS